MGPQKERKNCMPSTEAMVVECGELLEKVTVSGRDAVSGMARLMAVGRVGNDHDSVTVMRLSVILQVTVREAAMVGGTSAESVVRVKRS